MLLAANTRHHFHGVPVARRDSSDSSTSSTSSLLEDSGKSPNGSTRVFGYTVYRFLKEEVPDMPNEHTVSHQTLFFLFISTDLARMVASIDES